MRLIKLFECIRLKVAIFMNLSCFFIFSTYYNILFDIKVFIYFRLNHIIQTLLESLLLSPQQRPTRHKGILKSLSGPGTTTAI